ncbi:tetratricopeptide repeat protein [Thermogemmatispora carboxidivorans]|uniref:tetratricopeptide repeat protein n=1 Tax=Thermogemmatispora carboxidivorans TaxID=1382306 RepID=UPI0006994919|nr:tetratricopeptide repeat protein [Thermogemmatispora carboxidivorans]
MSSNRSVEEPPRPRVRLVEARMSRGWSQQEVAERLGTTHVNVSRWERGVTKPNPYFRRKLCRLFGLTEEELDLTPAAGSETPGRGAQGGDGVEVEAGGGGGGRGEQELQRGLDSGPLGEVMGGRPAEAIIDPMIPLPPPVRLVGRDAELRRIKGRLFAGEAVALSALNGLPGVGKTSLAVALAHDPEVRAYFKDGILWAALGPRPNMTGLLSRWGALLGLPATEVAGLTSLEAWARALRTAIGPRRMLLVIDDAWRIEEALALKVGGSQCAHLLTTRFAHVATEFAVEGAAAIAELGEEDSVQLLRLLAPAVVEQEPERVRTLVRAVGGLPLALTLIGNYLRKESYAGQVRRIRAALQRLSDARVRLGLTESRGPVEVHSSLPGEPVLSLQSVIAVSDEQLSQAARSALYALSVFPPKPASFSEEAALAVAACSTDELDALVDAGLLESNGGDRYLLHQVIADYARTRLEAQGEEAVQAPFARLMEYAIDYAEEHRTDYELLERESAVIVAGLEAAYMLGRQAELVRGAVTFAPFLLVRASYGVAELWLQRAQAAAQALGDQHGMTGVLLYRGQIALRQGDYTAAESYSQEGLQLARSLGDPERICALLTDLGTVFSRRGIYVQAGVYLQEGLQIARLIGHKEQICELLGKLGEIAARLGDYRQADAYLQEGLALAREIGDRERICLMLASLGASAGEQGKHLLAKEYAQEALSLARLMNRFEWMSLLLINLGEAETELGNYELADAYFDEALMLARNIDHKELMCAIFINEAIINRRRFQIQKAEVLLKEGLILAQELGVPYFICHALNEYGNIYIQRNQIEDARKTFQDMMNTIPGGAQDLLALAQYGLARIAALEGRKDEAKEMARKSFGILRSIGHRSIAEIEDWLMHLEDNGEGAIETGEQ